MKLTSRVAKAVFNHFNIARNYLSVGATDSEPRGWFWERFLRFVGEYGIRDGREVILNEILDPEKNGWSLYEEVPEYAEAHQALTGSFMVVMEAIEQSTTAELQEIGSYYGVTVPA